MVMVPKVLEIFTIRLSRAHDGWQLIHRGDGDGAKGAGNFYNSVEQSS